MVTVRSLDFETTGFPPHASVLEIGYTDISLVGGYSALHPTQTEIVKPSHPIGLEALAVHHITPDEIKRKAERTDKEALSELSQAPVDVWLAHNNEFEKKFFNPPEFKWICTYKVGVKLWPQSPKHTNQVLKYYLGVGIDDPAGFPPHRAGPDTYITALIFLEALKKMSIREMIEISSGPQRYPNVGGSGGSGSGGMGPPLAERGAAPQGHLLETCDFGQKYIGRPWVSIPDDFLRYCQANTRDPNVLFTVNYYLQERAKARLAGG